MTTPDRNEALVREMLERRAPEPPPWLADETIRAVRRVSQRRTRKLSATTPRAAIAIAVAAMTLATVAVVGALAIRAGFTGPSVKDLAGSSIDVGNLAPSAPVTDPGILSPSPSSPPEPTIRPDGLLPADSIAVVTTAGDGLRVRSAPGVGTNSKRLRPLLPKSTRMLVLDGPVAADGYEWYQVYAPYERLAGWVAAGDDGVSWIRAGKPRCPVELDREALYSTSSIDLMLCFRDRPMQAVVYGVGDYDGAPCDLRTDRMGCTWTPERFARQGYVNLGGFGETAPGETGAIYTMDVVIDPGVSADDLRTQGDEPRVTLSFDDPDAKTCRVHKDDGNESIEAWQAVLACRLLPVVVDIEAGGRINVDEP